MHIKRFEADTMEAALAEVKATFGPEALILSSRTLRKHRGSLGLFSKQRVEVQAARPRRGDGAGRAPEPAAAAAAPAASLAQGRDDVAELMRECRGLMSRMEGRAAFEEEMRSELRGLRIAMDRRFAEQAAGRPRADGEAGGGPESLAIAHLASQGLDLVHAEGVASRWLAAQAEGAREGIDAFFASEIESRLAPPRAAAGPDVRVLVGAPGAGKTTTLAKLAARNEEGEGEMTLVSMDPYRIGAEAQLEQYAALLDSPFVSADTAEALPAILRDYPKQRVFVDTAGRSGAIDGHLGGLQALRDRTRRAVSIEWVVDATTRPGVQLAQMERFGQLAPDRVIFTKIDECEDLRVPLNLLFSEGCPPLSWMGSGQRVPEDLEVAEVDRFRGSGSSGRGGAAWLQ